MKTILKNMLFAVFIASVTTSLRAQSAAEENSGSSTSEQEESKDETRTGKTEIQEPAGEPKGTDVTDEKTEETDRSTTDTWDTDARDETGESPRGRSPE